MKADGAKERDNTTVQAEAADRWLKFCSHGLMLLVILFTVVVRVRLLAIPLERDEGEYAYLGQLLLRGIPPYLHAYSMKLPGIFAAYALLMQVFGQTVSGIHLGLLTVNIMTIVLIFFLARRLFDSYAGMAACTGYAILSLSPAVNGVWAHATHFVVLFAVAGLLLLLKGVASGRRATLFASGVLFGLSFTMKQHGLLFVIFALLYLVVKGKSAEASTWKKTMGSASFFLVGAALPLGIGSLLLLKAGVFDRFFFWTFRYAHEYATEVPLSRAGRVFREQFTKVVEPSLILWLLAGTGLFLPLWRRRGKTDALLLYGFPLFSFLAVCPGFYFRGHYFILLLPAVSLLIGAAASSARNLLLAGRAPLLAWIVPSVVVIAAAGYSIAEGNDFWAATPVQADRLVYGANPFPESLAVAQYIRSHSTKDDHILVLGSEPEIYFYADRLSATGHIYMYGLMEKQPYALQMQEELIREAEAARPEFVVRCNVDASWLREPDSPTAIYHWMDAYIAAEYELLGLYDIRDEHTTVFVEGENARYYSRHADGVIFLYQRKKEFRQG